MLGHLHFEEQCSEFRRQKQASFTIVKQSIIDLQNDILDFKPRIVWMSIFLRHTLHIA